MSVAHLTHRVTRQVVETATYERLNRDGTPRSVEVVTHRTSCMCGRVFATGSELLTLARYLEHLPEPSTSPKGGDNA